MTKPWLCREKNFAIFCSLSKVLTNFLIRLIIKYYKILPTYGSGQEQMAQLTRSLLECVSKRSVEMHGKTCYKVQWSVKCVKLLTRQWWTHHLFHLHERPLCKKTFCRNILWPRQGGSLIDRMDLYTRCILMNASLSSLARRSAWSTHASKAKSCKKCLCQFNQNSCVSCKVQSRQSWQSGSLLWKRHHIEEWHHLCDGAAKVTGYLRDRASLCAQSFLGGQSEPLKSMEIRGPFEARSRPVPRRGSLILKCSFWDFWGTRHYQKNGQTSNSGCKPGHFVEMSKAIKKKSGRPRHLWFCRMLPNVAECSRSWWAPSKLLNLTEMTFLSPANCQISHKLPPDLHKHACYEYSFDSKKHLMNCLTLLDSVLKNRCYQTDFIGTTCSTETTESHPHRPKLAENNIQINVYIYTYIYI